MKYPGWSVYTYCGDNPINNIDPDGQAYKDAKGRDITYRIKEGKITFSKNATSDFKRVATSLILTETGRKQLDKGRNLPQNIVFNIHEGSKLRPEGNNKVTITYGETTHTGQEITRGEKTTYSATESKIDIYVGSINDPRNTKHTGLTVDQAIGTVAGHEIQHASQASTEIKEEVTKKEFFDEEKKLMKSNKRL